MDLFKKTHILIINFIFIRKNIQKTRTVIPHQILNNKPNQKDVVIVETVSNDNNKTSSQNNNQDNKNDSQPSIPANKPSSIKIKPISVSNNKKDNIQISSSCVLDSNFRPASPNQGQEMIIPEKPKDKKKRIIPGIDLVLLSSLQVFRLILKLEMSS